MTRLNGRDQLSAGTRRFYLSAMGALRKAKVPFLVGGAYALARYTGVVRHTKDLDLFVRRDDYPRALGALKRAGFRTELTFSHWLAKAHGDHGLIDLIFSSGNGACPVDEEWFRHSVAGRLWGVAVRFCPAEEMIWQKAYIMERDRHDGGDIMHLIRALGPRLDWKRLLRRFDTHWRVLLAQLVLFPFVYPGERQSVPEWVMTELLDRMQAGGGSLRNNHLCQGTLLSLLHYRVDVEDWGYRDGRQSPHGNMSRKQIDKWMAAFPRN